MWWSRPRFWLEDMLVPCTIYTVLLLFCTGKLSGAPDMVKGHSPDRLETYSSSAVFRFFLWMWLVCECVFGAAAS